MNKARRKWLESIIDVLTEQKDQIELVVEEEQEAYDNLPESIQYSERGEAMSDTVSDLEYAASDLEDILETLQEIIER
jgi:hypothetical protein